MSAEGPFTKLFSSITASTIWAEDDQTRIVWVTMLAMVDADGFVGASVPGLAQIARVPVEAVERALAKFHQPDKYSRSKEHDGRRIETVDRGWKLLNYRKLRDGLDGAGVRLQHVYFIRCAAGVKVGLSKNPWARAADLRKQGVAGPIQVLGKVDTDDDLIGQMYERFRPIVVAPGMYQATPELLAYVATVTGAKRTTGATGGATTVPTDSATGAPEEADQAPAPTDSVATPATTVAPAVATVELHRSHYVEEEGEEEEEEREEGPLVRPDPDLPATGVRDRSSDVRAPDDPSGSGADEALTNPDRPDDAAVVTVEQVWAAWKRWYGRFGGVTAHPIRKHREAYCTIADGVNRLPAGRVEALEALLGWFWLAPDGPVVDARENPRRVRPAWATPDHVAERFDADFERAAEWFCEGGDEVIVAAFAGRPEVAAR